MTYFETLDENSKILYSSGLFSGDYNEHIYLKRACNDLSNRPIFYLSIYTIINNMPIEQGYIYFYIDSKMKISNFIGVKVEKQFRGLNIGSLLVAKWIDLCLTCGYDFLGVNKKQRKPFLLYLLKTYGFEIFDKTLYFVRPDVITICKSKDETDNRKMLLFKDRKHEEVFKGTNIYKDDNYEIIHSKDGILTLDDVIMPLQDAKKNAVEYNLYDIQLAKRKTMSVIARHTR